MTKPVYTLEDLVLREITSPADDSLLNTLSEKEGVHPIASEDISKKRLGPSQPEGGDPWDKHCYGLFAPGCTRPEVAVSVRLLRRKSADGQKVENNHLTGNIQMILTEDGKPVEAPNTAIFYSITNMAKLPNGQDDPDHPVTIDRHTSISNRSPGEELIHQVAGHLKTEYGIENYSTLSPMRQGIGAKATGFAQWLEARVAEDAQHTLTRAEEKRLGNIVAGVANETLDTAYQKISFIHTHYDHLEEEDKTFFSDLMCDLGADYLAEAKSPKTNKCPLDRVEQFHLGNGAILGKVNYRPAGEATPSGTLGALGLMANYRYEPEHMENRKYVYQQSGRIQMDEDLERRHNYRMMVVNQPRVLINEITDHVKLMTQHQHRIDAGIRDL